MPEIPLGTVVGPHYTPSVSSNGELSWTNDGGLENPAPVNIKGESALINGVNTLTIEAGENVTMTRSGDTLRIAADCSFTEADALALETAGEKSDAAFSAIDGLFTGIQVPVYKRFISYGSFHMNAPSGGKLDDFHVASAMVGQTVQIALMAPVYSYFDNQNKHCVLDPEPVIRAATVAADGGLSVSFALNARDYYIVVTTSDLAAHYAGNNRGWEIEPVKILFTCRYTRNTGMFMGLDDIPAVSMADFADKLGYSLWYEQITDMTPEAVATTTADAVFLYSGSEYYELASTKPSEIPNQSAAYYRCLYQRKEF